MRVAVIGAGIVGVTTAFELAADGHEVVVFERRGSVAAETSFANAGVLAPGYVMPSAAPGMPLKLMLQLLRREGALTLDGLGVWSQLPWLWRWWRACRPGVHATNRAAMLRLARLSQERLATLTRALRLDYEHSRGYTVLLRSERELKRSRPGLKLLAELGVPFELLDAERARQVEPGLNPDTTLRAAVHLPQDGVGNCRQFAQLLKTEAERRGADFRFGVEVQRIGTGAGPTVTAAGTEERFDAVVLCSGAASAPLLQSLRLKLPLAPVWGYAVTAPLRQLEGYPDLGPRSAVFDERYRVTVSRLGQRVRVAGSSEIGGRADRYDERALRTLYRVLEDWFPGAFVPTQAQRWKGARPSLPDGPPVLGASGLPGVWLNLGHGASGWALACGSARVLAEQVAGRAAPLDMTALGLERLR
ncbi:MULTISPECIES: FAD-dependent oxidoreductase [Rubrivivax]|uniref:FAD-dependent oxidoreductase n=1 Tax=Rubrivivax benzoatilyticus TaxID=316997 RepID=A0ABX0HTD0_9BURK|nr:MULTISPECIES: FAD-dependent oxidoreductase [Rubrivivax]EGJ12238.1 D-amino-acid dehydrogenase [Rubrivivax benzoatilyticus JA2 = ATCC BAA-35]NHK98287.1 FAD-dependent oxidoreductase [Rubrivivax benzoatilyticus]NHL23938.1 FAD-dependent oxidoreductase [Rubrivivax benzoatilyticus]